MGASLILVGVTHRDPRGYARLLRLLRRERPDRVSVEVSRASVEYRRGPGRAKRRLLAGTPGREARELRAALRMPFEVRAARAYARETGVPVALLDPSRFAREKIAELDAWASEVIARGGDAPGAADLAPRAATRAAGAAPLLRDPELDERDAIAARRLRRWAEANPYATILHVGGHEHLVDDERGRSLYARLRDLAPRRILLGASAT